MFFILLFVFEDYCQRLNVLPIAYLNMNIPRIEGTATLMTLAQLKEMFFAVRIDSTLELSERIIASSGFSLVVPCKFFSLVRPIKS